MNFPKVRVRECLIFVLSNNIGVITKSARRMYIYNICCVIASNYMGYMCHAKYSDIKSSVV